MILYQVTGVFSEGQLFRFKPAEKNSCYPWVLVMENQNRGLVDDIIDNWFFFESKKRIRAVIFIDTYPNYLFLVLQSGISILSLADTGARTLVVLLIPVLDFIFPMLTRRICVIGYWKHFGLRAIFGMLTNTCNCFPWEAPFTAWPVMCDHRLRVWWSYINRASLQSLPETPKV